MTRSAELGVSADGAAPASFLTLGSAAATGEDRLIPGLTVHEELGHGAHAVVYRARRYGTDYALKLLRASVYSEASALAAFRREAALLACVDHPGVVSVHEVGHVRGRPYLVMDLVQGQTLAEAMLGSLSESRAVAIATDVADALSAAHRAGLTHRDVKPQNIMILNDGRAKLIDFGLAALATGASDGAVAGTFAYSAPEQTGMLDRLTDGRSDLYSLGVVLFHCVTGRLPFTATDVGELLRQHTIQAPPDIRQLRPDASERLAAVIAKLLAKDPDDRYQSGDGLAADLRALAAGQLADLGLADTPAGAAEPPLVGRTAELEELTAAWSRARSGRGSIALVTAPPGTGKSRLVRELLTTASGHLTLRGKCSPGDPVPMSPIRSAVERHLDNVSRMPAAERANAEEQIRRTAGRGASMLAALSPALAALLDSPELADEHRQEQFAVSVATFLAGLAAEGGGAVLCIDDVQWLDAGTHRVLHHLAEDLDGSSLLVVATARDDDESKSAYEAFAAEFTTASGTCITLGPLSDAAMSRVLAAQLGGAELTAELTAALTSRSGGNPFTAGEYTRAIIDAGLIRPSWGTWVLDESGLDGLDLPDNVLDLIANRVAGLGEEARELLVAAAASGVKLRPADLARICDVTEGQVLAVLRLAIDRRLVAAGQGGQYTFLHDRIREALLDGLSEADLRALHQRIAEALDGLHPGDSEYVYAVARHYELGEPGQDPARAYRAAVTAGRLALANHAPYQTLEFLDAAQAAADAGKLATGTEFHEAYGVACVRVGRFAEARGQLYFALADETVPVRRAMLHALVSQARQSDWEMPQALAAADDALAEIGRALPKNKLVLIVSTFTAYLMSLLIRWTGIGRGTATGEKRERMRIEAIALAEATQAAVTLRNMMLVSCLQFRQLYPANRIGYGPEYVKAHANMAAVAKIMGLRKLAARMFKKIAAVAVGLGDPRLVAYVNWVAVIVEATIRNSKIDNGVELRRVLAEHGRWLDAQETFNAVAALCNQLAMEGHIVEAQAWYERAKARANQVEPGPSHNMSMITPPLNAVLGRGEEATRQLDAAAEFLDSHPENREQLVTYVQQSLLSTVELGQLDDRFEKTVQLVADLRLTTWNTWPMQHHIWLSIAYGRLAQCLAAPEHALAERLAAAQVAVRRARKAATSRLAKAHLLIVQASFAQLSGDPQKALKLLAKADRRDRAIDAPVLAFEIARVRARAFGAMGNPSHARQHARLAISLAGECGWEGRARAVHAEFGLAQNTPFLRTGSGSSTVSAEVFRRRLDALQQVSSAAATVLDPRELAKVALRETIEIVRAERAFLFLVDDSGDLVPHLGRDAAGNDLDEVTGYGASLVRRVHRSGEPLVVTGAEDGEVHGSQSAVVHGLRSILVAPVRLKGRMLGVLYVDSRVAKGIFTKDDVDILMAITNHVAVSLETARAAQLEAAVRATSQQRDLAELLRSSMTEFSATLDPDEVLRRLLGAVSGALPGESACLLRWDGASFLVAAGTPEGGRVLNPDETESVVALASRPGATLGNAGPGRPVLPPWLLPAAASWIAIPLAARGTPVGLLVVASAVAGTYTDAHLQIAAALAGQGMTAYDNADLFAQVNRLAAIDPMTGVPNRRTFLADAGAALLSGAGSPMSALMLDIDHFKRVNDTHGHLVGDTVIEEVGARLRSAVRDGDLLGRYGGEEFALVLTASPERAGDVSRRLLDVVSGSPIETAAGPLTITVSIGMAHRTDADTDLAALLDRADQALYQAKQNGRNRISLA